MNNLLENIKKFFKKTSRSFFNFFKKIKIEVKLIIAAILGIIGFIIIVISRGKIDLKNSLKYELAKVKHDINVKNLEDKSSENMEELKELKEKEKNILAKIEYIKKSEKSNHEVTNEELDDFFDKRGF